MAERRPGTVAGTVIVWQQDDGAWRWRWTDGAGTELISHIDFPEVSAAEESARAAYPDADVLLPADEVRRRRGSRHSRPMAALRTAAAAIIVAAAAVVVVRRRSVTRRRT